MTKILSKIQKQHFIKFLTYIADTQGIGFIRSIIPGMYINQFFDYMPQIRFLSQFSQLYIDDDQLYQALNFVIFQRAAKSTQIEHIKKIKKLNPRSFIIWEVDDYLFDIPKWNYAHEFYKLSKNTTKQILNEVDGLTVSTPTLKNYLKEYNENIKVIPNHLPKFMWGDIFPAHEYKDEKEKVKIMYAGSSNHFATKNLLKKGIKGGDFSQELMDFMRKTINDYEWIIFGGFPDEMNDIKDKITYIPWVKYLDFPRTIKELEPDIFLAPLEINKFNRCKSNLKAIEACALGCPGIYTDIDPYKGLTKTAKTDEEFINHIEELANNINIRESVFKKDFNKLKNQIFWEDNDNVKKFINTHLEFIGAKI